MRIPLPDIPGSPPIKEFVDSSARKEDGRSPFRTMV